MWLTCTGAQCCTLLMATIMACPSPSEWSSTAFYLIEAGKPAYVCACFSVEARGCVSRARCRLRARRRARLPVQAAGCCPAPEPAKLGRGPTRAALNGAAAPLRGCRGPPAFSVFLGGIWRVNTVRRAAAAGSRERELNNRQRRPSLSQQRRAGDLRGARAEWSAASGPATCKGGALSPARRAPHGHRLAVVSASRLEFDGIIVCRGQSRACAEQRVRG